MYDGETKLMRQPNVPAKTNTIAENAVKTAQNGCFDDLIEPFWRPNTEFEAKILSAKELSLMTDEEIVAYFSKGNGR